MALTFRTGSDGKGSALTIEELDNNFRHFTGSHEISGSLTVSGSIIPSEATATLGTIDNPWKDLFISDSSIIFVSGSGESQVTSSFSLNSSGSISGSISNATSASYATTASSATSASYADNTPYNSGSCLIGCTSSTFPTGTRPEGTFEFVVSGSLYLMYVYLDGGWRYTTLT